MYLGVQPNLIERVVFEAARRDPALRAHYERQYADCYEARDPALRDQAFAALHDRWFRELGFRARLVEGPAAFPHVHRAVERVMVTQASSARNQTAELFGAPGQYTVVLAVAPAVLLDHDAFSYWSSHELMHIDDMLNPAFGFDPSRRIDGETDARRNLTRDRYAVLWAISVDARLEKSGRLPAGVREKRQDELVRAFGFVGNGGAAAPFTVLWNRCQCEHATHQSLLAWSIEGLPGGESPASESGARRLGTPCPLCGFPTFDWHEECGPDDDWVRLIRSDFPDWTLELGLCARCAEVYRACAPAQAALGSKAVGIA